MNEVPPKKLDFFTRRPKSSRFFMMLKDEVYIELDSSPFLRYEFINQRLRNVLQEYQQ